jgi:DNA repair protein RecO (recombination protein O)
MRVIQQPAYVLINRPYSETSWITEVFTKDFGRLSLMAKGARRVKSKLKGTLLPFQPLLISWSGKGEVPTLTGAEIDGRFSSMQLNAQICAFYCNEILVRALHKYDPHPKLYGLYQQTLCDLSAAYDADDALVSTEMNNLNAKALHNTALLRRFEIGLLSEAGFGLNFAQDARTKQAIKQDAKYIYQPGLGFIELERDNANGFSGAALLYLDSDNIAKSTHTDRLHQLEARRIMRLLLKPLVGERPLSSRELFFPQTANKR